MTIVYNSLHSSPNKAAVFRFKLRQDPLTNVHRAEAISRVHARHLLEEPHIKVPSGSKSWCSIAMKGYEPIAVGWLKLTHSYITMTNYYQFAGFEPSEPDQSHKNGGWK